jgi:hypothetical protein
MQLSITVLAMRKSGGTDTEDLAGEKQVFTVTIPRNGSVLTQVLTHTAADAFLIVRYTLDKK